MLKLHRFLNDLSDSLLISFQILSCLLDNLLLSLLQPHSKASLKLLL